MSGLPSVTNSPYQTNSASSLTAVPATVANQHGPDSSADTVSKAEQSPPPQSRPQQSPQTQAQIATIYAEAQAQHWSQAQINLAITKALEQSGSASTSGTITSSADSEQPSLIDVNA